MTDDSDIGEVATQIENLANVLDNAIGIVSDRLHTTESVTDCPEYPNIFDATNKVADKIGRLADAITPNVCGATDAAGGHIESLTEAVIGVTAGLVKIADAIESLAYVLADKNR